MSIDVEDVIMWAVGVLAAVLAAVLLATVGWVLWSAWVESQRPTFELKRDDWACTRNEPRTHLQLILVGRSLVPVPTTTDVCLQYSRVAG